MDSSRIDQAIIAAVRDGIVRTVAIVGLCAVALIHVMDAPGNFAGPAAYIGGLYLAVIAGSLVLATAFVRSSDRRLWAAAGGLAASVIIGFVLSRTTGLPYSTDDIGNWAEPLGMASLFVEGAMVALAGGVLAARRPRKEPTRIVRSAMTLLSGRSRGILIARPRS